MISVGKLFHEAKLRIILRIYEDEGVISQDLRRRTGITYSHILKTVNDLERNDVICTRKEGRCRHLFLTDEGWDLAGELKGVMEEME